MSGRADQLLIDAMDWLETDADVRTGLGATGYGDSYGDDYGGSLDDAPGDVIPIQIAKESEADPRIAVATSETSSTRNNRQEEKTFEVRVIVDATQSYVQDEDRGSILDLKRLKSDVADVLTTHRDGWGAGGVQADEEIAWSEDVNRYLGVMQFAYERDEPHAVYD